MTFFGLPGVARTGSPLAASKGGGVEPVLAFNTGVSFVTNTKWQSYVPETTMGYLLQMAGLTVHNFVSAAVGVAIALALIRGFARCEAEGIGNFWVDVTRITLYVPLPVSIVTSLVFASKGCRRTSRPMSMRLRWKA